MRTKVVIKHSIKPNSPHVSNFAKHDHFLAKILIVVRSKCISFCARLKSLNTPQYLSLLTFERFSQEFPISHPKQCEMPPVYFHQQTINGNNKYLFSAQTGIKCLVHLNARSHTEIIKLPTIYTY